MGSARLKLMAAGLVFGGLFSSADAQTPPPIRIGVMAKFAQINGAAILNGATLATEEINAAGGVKGRKVELITYDDQGSASDAVLAFQRAVKQDKVQAIVGTFLSEIAI